MDNEIKEGILTILLITDIIIIIYMILIKTNIYLILFDTIVSVILLIDIFFEVKNSDNKKKSLKSNSLQIIASIPYDLILIGSGLSILKFLRFFRIIKILKIASVIKPIMNKIEKLNKRVRIDKIAILIVGILLISALIISISEDISFGKSIYLELITFSSIGYGDIVMNTSIGKIISILLALTSIFGIGLLSAIAVSYFQINKDAEITDLKKENAELKKEINEIKKQNETIIDLLKNKK